MNHESCGTLACVPDADHLWRSVRHDASNLAWHDDEKRWIPAGTALQFDPDWSGRWREHLIDIHGLGPSDVAEAHRPLVFEVQVEAIRMLGMKVEHTPQATDPTDCAHASTWYRTDGAQPTRPERALLRNALAVLLTLVHGAIAMPPPPGA